MSDNPASGDPVPAEDESMPDPDNLKVDLGSLPYTGPIEIQRRRD